MATPTDPMISGPPAATGASPAECRQAEASLDGFGQELRSGDFLASPAAAASVAGALSAALFAGGGETVIVSADGRGCVACCPGVSGALGGGGGGPDAAADAEGMMEENDADDDQDMLMLFRRRDVGVPLPRCCSGRDDSLFVEPATFSLCCWGPSLSSTCRSLWWRGDVGGERDRAVTLPPRVPALEVAGAEEVAPAAGDEGMVMALAL